MSFTSEDIEEPTLVSVSPDKEAINVAIDSDIELTFSEAVDTETGSIYIKKSFNDSIKETIDVTSSQVTGSGTNVITINPTNDFESTTQYYLQIDASAFDDFTSNSFSGINDKTSFSFTTADVVSPTGLDHQLLQIMPPKYLLIIILNSLFQKQLMLSLEILKSENPQMILL